MLDSSYKYRLVALTRSTSKLTLIAACLIPWRKCLYSFCLKFPINMSLTGQLRFHNYYLRAPVYRASDLNLFSACLKIIASLGGTHIFFMLFYYYFVTFTEATHRFSEKKCLLVFPYDSVPWKCDMFVRVYGEALCTRFCIPFTLNFWVCIFVSCVSLFGAEWRE